MKQKIIFIVLLVVTMYIPAPSKECGKITQCIVVANPVSAPAAIQVPAGEEDISMLPASPFSRLL